MMLKTDLLFIQLYTRKISIIILISLRRNIGEFYNGNTSLPVFDWKPMNKTTSEILKILLRPIADNVTCKVPPHNISHNVSFLLDTSGLESKNDWKCDDMGAWKNNKVQRIHLDLEPDRHVVPVDNTHEGYTLKRIYYNLDLRKIVSFLPGKKEYFVWLIYLKAWLIKKVHGRTGGALSKGRTGKHEICREMSVKGANEHKCECTYVKISQELG